MKQFIRKLTKSKKAFFSLGVGLLLVIMFIYWYIKSAQRNSIEKFYPTYAKSYAYGTNKVYNVRDRLPKLIGNYKKYLEYIGNRAGNLGQDIFVYKIKNDDGFLTSVSNLPENQTIEMKIGDIIIRFQTNNLGILVFNERQSPLPLSIISNTLPITLSLVNNMYKFDKTKVPIANFMVLPDDQIQGLSKITYTMQLQVIMFCPTCFDEKKNVIKNNYIATTIMTIENGKPSIQQSNVDETACKKNCIQLPTQVSTQVPTQKSTTEEEKVEEKVEEEVEEEAEEEVEPEEEVEAEEEKEPEEEEKEPK